MKQTGVRVECPSELKKLVDLVRVSLGDAGWRAVRLVRCDRVQPGYEIRVRGTTADILYATPAQAGRALGTLLSGEWGRDGDVVEETPFTLLGVMLDCSRNAVMRPEHIQEVWIPRLALLGYNLLMLYTEDTYELPGEPYFGWQRGAYTAAELRSLVAAASAVHIEVIPCIQTLGHLERILRHSAYRDVRDTASVLMVGEPKTYALIEKMIGHWAGITASRRLHVGMDEAHDLGRGRYLDRFGYRPAYELFQEHLGRVAGICRRHGVRPMIWSDMFFRLGSSSGGYYDPRAIIPPRVIRKIPRNVDLVYWDYYHDSPGFYREWITRHRAMGRDPIMASGIWTWNRYWYDYRRTEANAGACVRACREAGLRELFFTMWGDNGAYCDHDSAFAGMAFCAELAYSGSEAPDSGRLEKRFQAICGGHYAAHRLAGDLHGGVVQGWDPDLWDDPFFETRFRTWAGDDPGRMAEAAQGYQRLAERLARYRWDRKAGDCRHAWRVAVAFAERYTLSAHLLAAYRKRDRRAVERVRRRIPRVLASVRAVADSFRSMWMAHNKPQGFETLQARWGMLEARYREMDKRLCEYLGGKIRSLAELDQPCPPSGTVQSG